MPTISERFSAFIKPPSKNPVINILQTAKYVENDGKATERNPALQRDAAQPVKRISPRELKLAYLQDPIVFNAINTKTQLLLSAGYKLVGSDKEIAAVNNFMDRVGNAGSSTDKDSMMELVVKNNFIFGRAFLEKIKNKRGNRLLDLDVADPEVIDYARDNNNRVLLDEKNIPLGYVEYLPMEISKPKLSFPAPKNIKMDMNAIYIPADRVVHFRLYTTGDGITDIGIVEPVYASVQFKKNIEDSFSNYLARIGYPILYGSVGDPTHEPTEENIKNMLFEMKKVRSNDVAAFAYYAQLKILESSAPDNMLQNLEYFVNQIVSGVGVPMSFATGGGQDTNRATLARQEYIMKISLKDTARRVSTTWENEVFKIICEQEGLKTYPRMVWNEIALEELDSKSVRLQGYAKTGLLTPTPNTEAFVRKSEDLPPMEKDFVPTAKEPDTGVSGKDALQE